MQQKPVMHNSYPHELRLFTSEVIFGLPYIHPIAIQSKRIQAFISDNQRKGFLLNGGQPQLDAFKDCWIQHIDASIDLVANKGLRTALWSSIFMASSCLTKHDSCLQN